MEYIQGRNLLEFMEKRDYQLPEAMVRHFGLQILRGVEYLHNLGIIHRDLKLENLMMTSDESDATVKIVDFGLSKIVGHNEKTQD